MPGATTEVPATLDDLMRTEGKAELIGGSIVRFMASGVAPSRVALEIAIGLRGHARRVGAAVAYPDGVGYALDPPSLPERRQSFQPDASSHVGPMPSDPMRFIDGAPTFAVEVRSEDDYGAAAEREMGAKQADYLAAGTLAVWDVDPLARTVAVHRIDPSKPDAIYGMGRVAGADPAVPGRRLAVDDLFS